MAVPRGRSTKGGTTGEVLDIFVEHLSPLKGCMTARARHLWTCFRLTEEDYEKILQLQGGVCAGCGKPPYGSRLAVDHCHKTGRIRGLLCWLCNKAIGILRDRARTLSNLGAYLETPPAPLALGKETYGLIGQAKASKKIKVYGPPDNPPSGVKAALKRKRKK